MRLISRKSNHCLQDQLQNARLTSQKVLADITGCDLLESIFLEEMLVLLLLLRDSACLLACQVSRASKLLANGGSAICILEQILLVLQLLGVRNKPGSMKETTVSMLGVLLH